MKTILQIRDEILQQCVDQDKLLDGRLAEGRDTWPDCLYVGRDEYLTMKRDAHPADWRPAKDSEKFMGLKVIQAQVQSHLRVGTINPLG